MSEIKEGVLVPPDVCRAAQEFCRTVGWDPEGELEPWQAVRAVMVYVLGGYADQAMTKQIHHQVASAVSRIVAHFSEGQLQCVHDNHGTVQVRKTAQHPDGPGDWQPCWTPGLDVSALDNDEREPWRG